MALQPGDYYLSDKPNFLQQGDVLTGVPLVLLPASPEMIVLRGSHRAPIDDPQPGSYEAIRELALSDAFDEAEYVMVSAVRSLAVLMTPTCDLVDTEDWLVCPLHHVAGSELDVGNLRAGKYMHLMWLPKHDHYEEAYIDLSDHRPIRKASVDLSNRLASMTRDARNELVNRYVSAMGRNWGFDAGEAVPPKGKHETGKFRCARCLNHDIAIKEIEVNPGESFPECEGCSSSAGKLNGIR